MRQSSGGPVKHTPLLLPLLGALTAFAGVASVWASAGPAYSTADEAALAASEELMGGPATGFCDGPTPGDPNSLDFCIRLDAEHSGAGYAVYTTQYFNIADANSWIGVQEVEEGWKPYDSGYCDIWYCRMTDPDGNILQGWPNGDADCNGTADSADALQILQFVAGLGARPSCDWQGDVVVNGQLTPSDATVILQYDAGLIIVLPLDRFS